MSVRPSSPGVRGPVTVWTVCMARQERASPAAVKPSREAPRLRPSGSGHYAAPLMRARLVVPIALVAAALVAIAFAGRLLVVDDPLPRAADAIVILAGSVPDRAVEASELYRAGVAPRILLTREHLRRGEAVLRARGVRLPEGDALTHQALRALGVPDAAVVILRRRNTSTESEARTIARFACRHGMRRLVVVTSRAHTRRARLILRQALGPDVGVAVRFARHDFFPAGHWWRVRSAAKQVLTEYEKLAHYWLRERWHIPPCGGLRRRR